jgi:hypothetical protein
VYAVLLPVYEELEYQGLRDGIVRALVMRVEVGYLLPLPRLDPLVWV